ncbi:SDR family oxidoreductase [Rhizobium sp. XQZ8]|uniref:SDR family oxidoreductase n=1 Tax=Rhizobium populisoli TaxID=2859785 RepID=UPI001C672F0A|nr:SDR family oxidoreductase [Rhizobium populisoli]MBW6425375.1 SDR family oxidoreductase [Rhizobium populisoli]
MNILVTGANGLIGSAICGRLIREGHQVVGVVRPGSRRPYGVANTIYLDVATATAIDGWLPVLEDVDAVVNCVGVLQQSAREDLAGAHVAGPAALFQACEQLGVRRVVHFSAIGVDRQQPSAFSDTKLRGDDVLMARDLDWVILRPSVVLGRSAFGASALIRGLAALPVLPIMPAAAELQVVQLEDVVETVVRLIEPNARSRVVLELVGPQRLRFEDVVAFYRRWLGRGPATQIRLPTVIASLLYTLGDLASLLGWRPALRTTAKKEIVRGATGDPQPWAVVVGIYPRSLPEVLSSTPATVQERWFANLFFLKPLMFIVLPLFWISTGIISLTAGFDEGMTLMDRAAAGQLSAPSVIAGALADIVIGAMIAFRRTSRVGLWAAVLVSIFYAIAGTILVPALWNEPLGPLLKIGPILVLHLVALAILEER